MKKLKHILYYFILILWSVFILAIIGWIFYSSFKTNLEIYQKPWALPSKITLQNYISAWTKSKMQLYFINSLIVVFLSIGLTILASSMAAYVLTRFKYRFNNLILSVIVFGMSVPSQLILIPLYTQLSSLGMVSTRIGLIAVYVTLWIPFSIYVLTGFFKTIPQEMEESAIIDGCGEYTIFWRIMFPLVQPGLIAVAVFNFVSMWNEYLLALVYTSSNQKLRTISLGMYALKDSMMYSSNWGGLFAAVIIMMIPSVIVYITLQKYVIAGLTLGAVKG